QESEKAGWFDPRKLPAPLMPGTAGVISAFVGYDVDPERQKEDKQHGVYVDAATAAHDLPLLNDRNRAWDADGAEQRVRRWASSDGSGDKDKIDWPKYARAFAWVDLDKPKNFGGYKLPFADVVDGKLVAVPRGVFSDGAALMGSRGGVKIPPADVAGVKKRLEPLFRKMSEAFNDRGIVPPWEKEGRTDREGRTDSVMRGVHRIDRGAVGSVEMTRQGFMRVDGFATRIGVFTYVLPDGTIRRELRHPDDVLKADSLTTLIGVPVTDEHPPVMVDAKNSRTYARGMTGDAVQPQPDGKILVGLTVTDSGLIQRIDDGSQVELSSGYDCDLLMQPGQWQGQHYDARQQNITYNHLAVTRKGRAGPDVRLRLDAAEQVDGAHETRNYETEDPMAGEVPGDKTSSMGVDALARKVDAISEAFAKFIKKSKKKGKKADAARKDAKRAKKDAKKAAKKAQAAMMMDGKTITVTDPDGDAKVTTAGSASGKTDSADTAPVVVAGKKGKKGKNATQEADRQRGRADALEAQLKKRLDGMDAEVSELARTRISLITTAAGIVDKSVKLDALSDREIKIAVVKTVNADADPSKWSEDYLQGAFDGAVKAAGSRVDSAAAAARLIEGIRQND
ncbi:MAG: DUF2213 domain-containing protein, partial [Cyanobacteria bacterium REEB65]|nr:DUF2213 domain-containing protein [Cyanobacteria bacterium REEB65]